MSQSQSHPSSASRLWMQALPSDVLHHCVLPLLRLSDVSHLASTCSVWRHSILPSQNAASSSSNPSAVSNLADGKLARFTAYVSRLDHLQSFTHSCLRFYVSALHLGSAAAAAAGNTSMAGVIDWWPSSSELTLVSNALPHLHILHTQIDFRIPLLAPWRANTVTQTRDFPSKLLSLHVVVALPSKLGPLAFIASSHPHGAEQLLQDIARCTSHTLESLTLVIHTPSDRSFSKSESSTRFEAAWFQPLRDCKRLSTLRWQANHVPVHIRHVWTSANYIAVLKQLSALTELELPAPWDAEMLELLAENDGSSSSSSSSEVEALDSHSSSSSFSSAPSFQLPGPPLVKPSFGDLHLENMNLMMGDGAAHLARFPSLRVLNPKLFCVAAPTFLTRLTHLEEVTIRGIVGMSNPPVVDTGQFVVPSSWMEVTAEVLCESLSVCKKITSLSVSNVAIQSEQLETLLPNLPELKHLSIGSCPGFNSLHCLEVAASHTLSQTLESFRFQGGKASTITDPASALQIIISRFPNLNKLQLLHPFDERAPMTEKVEATLIALIEQCKKQIRQCEVWPVVKRGDFRFRS